MNKCKACEQEFNPNRSYQIFCSQCNDRNTKRQFFKERGLCIRCGDVPPAENIDQCRPCADKGLKTLHKVVNDRRQRGLCDCGKCPPVIGKLSCEECLHADLVRSLRRVHSFDDQDLQKYEIATNCDWCGAIFNDKKAPHVDHDHACCSGTKHCWYCTRGFLHYDCNQRRLWAHEFMVKECGFVSPQLAAYQLKFPVPRLER